MSGRATRGPRAEDVLGRVTLVTGKEELLNERTVVAVRDAVRRHDAEAEISETQAAGLTLAEVRRHPNGLRLGELEGGRLDEVVCTPSGTVELVHQRLVDDVPRQVSPWKRSATTRLTRC